MLSKFQVLNSYDSEPHFKPVRFFPEDFFESNSVQNIRPDTEKNNFQLETFQSAILPDNRHSLQNSVCKNLRKVLINKNFKIIKRAYGSPIFSPFSSISNENSSLPEIKTKPIFEEEKPWRGISLNKNLRNVINLNSRISVQPENEAEKIPKKYRIKALLKPMKKSTLETSMILCENKPKNERNEEKLFTRTAFFNSPIENKENIKESHKLKNRVREIKNIKVREMKIVKKSKINKENEKPNIQKSEEIPTFTFGTHNKLSNYVNI